MSDNASIFNQQEWLRYSRHIQLPKFGAAGQTRLKQAHVVIIGMGGLGAPVGLYLAAAGVGHITIFDGDTVDVTNLQRQVIFTQDDVGKSKALSAKHRMLALNPHIRVDAIEEFFVESHKSLIPDKCNLVLDCTDNFAARYLINDMCLEKHLPWLYASIHQFSGQCALFTPGKACFRCLFPAPPEDAPDCNTAGVIGVLPGLLGLIEANEAIKFLAGLPCSLDNHLLLFDALDLSQHKIQLAVDPSCFCQSGRKEAHAPTEACESPQRFSISVEEFNQARDQAGTRVIDVRDHDERLAFHIGGEHIPLSDLVHQDSWDKSFNYLCYCQSGIRSGKAAEHLQSLGLSAKSLDGGLLQWLKGVGE